MNKLKLSKIFWFFFSKKNRFLTSSSCLKLVFTAHGILLGTLSAQIPGLRDRLALAPQALGLALFFASAGALLGMPLTGWAMQRAGTTVLIRGGGVLAGLGLIGALDAQDQARLSAMLFVFGMGFGVVDVAMNAQAVAREQAEGRAILGGIHAMWSVGSFFGSLGGAALLGLVSPGTEAVLVIGIAIVVLLAASLALRGEAAAPTGRDGGFPWANRRVWLLGLLMSLSFGIEGGIADWSGIYLHLSRGMTTSMAPLGYSLFALAMVFMRFGGDFVRARLGNQRILLGGFLVAGGLAVALLPVSVPSALLGFALCGLGIANIVPALFALAGARGSGSSAGAAGMVSTIGYAGILLAPPLLGVVAEATSIGMAMALLAVSGAVIGFAAIRLR